jgi:small subunit ribosomal protein S19
MSRSIWKGLYCYSKVFTLKKNKIWSRNSTIPSCLLGQQVFVYNGKNFRQIKITREKIGFKFGEFSFTRAFFRPKLNKKSLK